MIFAIELGVAMILSIPITYIIIHLHKAKDRKLIFGDKLEDNQDDNPLLLTVKAMEAELAELHENNIHMKRIQQLEKDIEEANKRAEALSNNPPHEPVVEKASKENKKREQEELRQLLMEASKEFTKATYGQWNIIPRDGLSHEERVNIAMEKIGESMQHSTPNSKKLDEELTRQEFAHFRTYTRQTGWSSYYDVKLK